MKLYRALLYAIYL